MRSLYLSRMQARYRFEYHAAQGVCTVDFSFAGYSPGSRVGEFEVRLLSVSPDREYRQVNKMRVYRDVNQIVQAYAQQVLQTRRRETEAQMSQAAHVAGGPVGNGADGEVPSQTLAHANVDRASDSAAIDPGVATTTSE